MIKLDKTNFEETIKSDKPILVKFGAIWCGPCRALTMTLKGMESNEFPFYEVDIEENADICKQYKIQGIPVLAVFKNGEMIKSHTGSMSKDEIQKFIENN